MFCNMKRRSKLTRAERAVRQVRELNDLVWALNRAGYRAGWHGTRPGWDLLAAVGVDFKGYKAAK